MEQKKLDDDAFGHQVIGLLGPTALACGKLSLYDVAEMFWNAGITYGRNTGQQCEIVTSALLQARRDLNTMGNEKQMWHYVDPAIRRINAALHSNVELRGAAR